MIMQDFEIFDAMPIVFDIKVTYLEGFGHQKVQKDYCAAEILRTSNMIMQGSEIFDAIPVVFAVKVTYLEGFGHQKSPNRTRAKLLFLLSFDHYSNS